MDDGAKISISKLVTILVAVFIFIPFIIFCTILLMINENYSNRSYGNYMVQLLESAKLQIDANEDLLSDGILNLYHHGIADILEQDSLTEQERRFVQDEIQTIYASYSGSVSAVCLKHGDDTYMAGDNYELSEFVADQDQEVAAAGGARKWIGPYFLQPKRKSGYKMLLARSINGREKKDLAQIYLVVEIEKITAAFKNRKFDPMAKFILNADGEAIYTELSGNGLQEDFLKLHFQEKSGYQTARLAGKKYFIAHYKSYQNDWTVGVMLLKSETTKELVLIRFILIILACIYVLFLVIMIILIQKNMITPIRFLTEKMGEFSEGDFEIRAERTQIKELDKLNLHFNEMIIRIGELIERNHAEEREKNEFKIKALKSQLDPHFIFNTLNTIKWMALINRQENIKNMIETLVRLLMAYTRDKEGAYTVTDELNLIKDYATIQKARFMNFDIEMDVESGTENCKIAKFLLQPVVENSIIHGFTSGKGRRGKIKITIYKQNDLYIRIEDNGVGFEVNAWQEREAGHNVEHAHIALNNIQQIIKTEYGQEYGMEITSEVGAGTVVTYRLPVIMLEPEVMGDD